MVERTLAELQVVELTEDVDEGGKTYARGTVGAIMHVHVTPREAYLVEICDNAGETKAMLTVLPTQVRALPSQICRDETK